MKSFIKLIVPIIITIGLFLASCGGQSSGDSNKNSASSNSESGLTEFQQENGIGPVTEEINLEEIDKALAKKGESMFETKCSACHKLDDRYVGPAQRNVLDNRTPEYVMNMILNPAEMVKKHPEAKKMLAEFMTPMPNQNLSREEARQILEYFRYINENPEVNEIQ